MREKLIELLNKSFAEQYEKRGLIIAQYTADHLIANGVTIPVRCKECKHGIWNEEDGLWQCVFSAEFNDDTGEWFGFIDYNYANHFCANGERRTDDTTTGGTNSGIC